MTTKNTNTTKTERHLSVCTRREFVGAGVAFFTTIRPNLLFADQKLPNLRMDFQAMRPVGPGWTLPLPLETHPDKPFVFAERGSMPQFSPSDKVKVVRRKGKTHDGEGENQLAATCPPAHIGNPYGRVIYYVATPVDAFSGKTLFERRAMANDYFMPVEHAQTVPGEVVFGVDEFAPGSKIVFRMKAVNAAGRCSGEIVSAPVEIPAKEASA